MYHYTGINAFDQIIKTKKLRMTRAEFLNDPDECSIFFEMIKNFYYSKESEDLFNSTIESLSVTEDKKDIISDIVFEKYTIVDFIMDLKDNINFYILSLSLAPDELSMWNYYGDNGIMLELDEKKLIKSFCGNLKENYYIACGKVRYLSKQEVDKPINLLTEINFKQKCKIYEKNNQEINYEDITAIQGDKLHNFLITYINNFVKSVSYLLDAEPNFETDYFSYIYNNCKNLDRNLEFKRLMQIYMTSLSAFFKPDTFAYENEYRIVCFSTEINNYDLEKYAIYKSFYKPYIEFEIRELPSCINSVTLSPMFRNSPIPVELHTQVVERFMNQEFIGLGDDSEKQIEVTISEHSVRW